DLRQSHVRSLHRGKPVRSTAFSKFPGPTPPGNVSRDCRRTGKTNSRMGLEDRTGADSRAVQPVRAEPLSRREANSRIRSPAGGPSSEAAPSQPKPRHFGKILNAVSGALAPAVQKRHQHDVYIQPKRPVVHVVKIVPQPFFKTRV